MSRTREIVRNILHCENIVESVKYNVFFGTEWALIKFILNVKF